MRTYANIQVPSLTIAAWYDIFQGGSLRNYVGLKAHAGNEAARSGQHLLVTIGGHAGGGRNIGTVDFGSAAAEYDENDLTLAWYEYLFLGKQNQFAGKPVRIFVMGDNKWRDEDSWPLERAKSTRYELHSSANANSAAGGGKLVDKAVKLSDKPDTFVYDPANPVPTVGGPLCCDVQHLAPGPRDQKEVEARQDVLVYSTDPLDQDVEVTGPVSLDLFASSSAVDTDFTAKLVDIWPNGYAQNLTEGILRARYRESTTCRQTHRARQNLRVQHRPLVHEQCLSQRPPHPPRNLKQQLPALRSQPQHRQTRRHRLDIRKSNADHLPRSRPPQRPHPARCAALMKREADVFDAIQHQGFGCPRSRF